MIVFLPYVRTYHLQTSDFDYLLKEISEIAKKTN